VPVVCVGECAEIFRELYLSGARFSEIEAKTGVPASLVSIYARAMGLPARRGPSPRRKVSDAKLEELRRACAKGCTSGEAAKILGAGVSLTTARAYLAAMGLYMRSRGGKGRRCPEIPEQVLVEAVENRTPDHIVAMRIGTSLWCVQLARLRRGLLKNRPVRGRLERDLKTVLGILEEEGFATSKALRDMGVVVNRELLEALEQRGAVSFKLEYCATQSYTVFPLRLCRQRIIYLRGREADVVAFLSKVSIVPPHRARRAVRAVLRKNGAPPELVEAI